MHNHSFLDRDFTNMARGIAILLVFAGHVGSQWSKSLVALGGIGVAIFLFLSGYGLEESYKKSGLDGFWKKKILRVLIPYIVWILLYHLVVLITPLTPKAEDIHIIPRYWFVEYIIGCYIAFWLTHKFTPKFVVPGIMLCAIVAFVLCRKTLAEQSLSFIAGVLCSMHKTSLSNIKNNKYFLLGCLFLIIGTGFFFLRSLPALQGYDEESLVLKTIPLFMKLMFGLSIIVLLHAANVKMKWIGWIGLIAFELYLVQMPFFSQINHQITLLILFFVQCAILSLIVHFASNKIVGLFKK